MKSPTYKGNTKRRVRCVSGAMGERSRLQSRYLSFGEWEFYDSNYGLAKRLGYSGPRQAWNANPVVESSAQPYDFRRVSA